jgi:NTP pyrophosphatase (non-canonical NTP hydrolase)
VKLKFTKSRGIFLINFTLFLFVLILEIHINLYKLNNKMTIKEAQSTVDQWINTIGIRYFNELTNTALLTEEVGEVARLMARIYGEQSFKNTESAATAHEDLADEMADVLFVLICLANQTGIDLESALVKSLEKKTKRDKERHAGNEKLH